MMAADRKQLSEARAIDLTRCHHALDKALERRALEARLLAAARTDVDGERRWFALRSANRSEIELRDALADSQVDAVVPVKQVKIARRGGGRGKVVHRPVLKHLVFVRIVPSDTAFAGLLRVKGVAAMIGTAGLPHPIGDHEMNGFMDLAQKGAFDERNTPTGLKVGSGVKISVGPYADFHGVLAGYARGRTARVLTHLFGREMVVDVMLAHLRKLD